MTEQNFYRSDSKLKEYENSNFIYKSPLYLNHKSTELSKNLQLLIENRSKNDINKSKKFSNTNIKEGQFPSNTETNGDNHYFLTDNKLFKNIKLYTIIKPNLNTKQRNTDMTKLPECSLTEGNMVYKQNASTLYPPNNNNHIMKNNDKQKTKNSQSNYFSLINKSNGFKLLKKSRSNFSGPKNKIPCLLHVKNKTSNNMESFQKINEFLRSTSYNNVKNNSINKGKNLDLYLNNKKSNYKNEENKNKSIDNIPNLKNHINSKVIEYFKKEIETKDEIIENQEKRIRELIKSNEKNEILIKKLKNNYDSLKEDYKILFEENFDLKLIKDQAINDKKVIKELKEKEEKLMRIFFNMKNKGIEVNSFIEENKGGKTNLFNNEINYFNDLSNRTLYFPDKVNMKSIMETKQAKTIPKINLNLIPDYSDS